MANGIALTETLRLAEGSYSQNRYADWEAVAAGLLDLGYTSREAATLMRSKYPRWAADASDAYYGNIPASIMIDYVKRSPLEANVLALWEVQTNFPS